MTNFPFRDPITIRRLSGTDLADLLHGFEDAWADANGGERLTSEAFYERYLAGEFDSLFGTSWATYYEAACELERRRGLHDTLPGELLGV